MASHSDQLILAAFERGRAASLSDRPRSANPHRPISDRALWDSWNAGYDHEEGPVYSVKAR